MLTRIFDGSENGRCSVTTAEMAIWLDAAAVLVIDVAAMAGGAAAIVHGLDTLISEPPVARMQPSLAKLGYIEIEIREAAGWLPRGERARAHEFRYSEIDPMPETICRAYREPAEGYLVKSVLASYVHLHFLSCPGFAERFVAACAQRRETNTQ